MKKKMCDREKGVHYNHKSTLRCKCGFFVKLYVQKRIDYIDKKLISFVEDLKEMRKEIKLKIKHYEIYKTILLQTRMACNFTSMEK